MTALYIVGINSGCGLGIHLGRLCDHNVLACSDRLPSFEHLAAPGIFTIEGPDSRIVEYSIY